MKQEINSISEYWKSYQTLYSNIEKKNKLLAQQLRQIQSCINGLTDGWYDFLASFKKIVSENSNTLTLEDSELAYFLISTLENSLKSR